MDFTRLKPQLCCRRKPVLFSEGVTLHTRLKPAARADSSAAFTSLIPTPLLRNSWRTKIASSAEPELSAARKQCPTTFQAAENAAKFTLWFTARPINSRRASVLYGGRPNAAPSGSNRSYILIRRSRCDGTIVLIRISASIRSSRNRFRSLLRINCRAIFLPFAY